MKKKIIGIFICMLLATTVVSATNIDMKNDIQTTTAGVDAPVWKVGDSWTYNFHETLYKYDKNHTLWSASFHNSTITQTITDVTGDKYFEKVTSINNEGNAFFGSFRLRFTPKTIFTQEYEFRKTDLAGIREYHQEKGFAFLLVGNIPIPTQYLHTREWIFSEPFVWMPFPLTAGTNGTLPGNTFTYQEKCSIYWGFISLLSGSANTYSDSPHKYNCEMVNITVPAGTFKAYNVSVEYSFGSGHSLSWQYYVPEIGNTVKTYISADWDSRGEPGTIYESELISTTYTP